MAIQQDLTALTQEGVFDQLSEAVAGVLSGAKLHLFKSGFTPTFNSVAADFAAQECDFTGYAASTLTWSAPGLDSTGQPITISDRAFFQATDALAPNTVGGAWLQADVTGPPASHTALGYWVFNPTVPMTQALSSLGVVVGWQLPGNTGYALADY